MWSKQIIGLDHSSFETACDEYIKALEVIPSGTVDSEPPVGLHDRQCKFISANSLIKILCSILEIFVNKRRSLF